MQAVDPDYVERVRQLFATARFMVDVGIRCTEVGVGFCESRLLLAPRHLQQDAFVHAGVLATMADHTAGGAAATLIAAESTVLTVEFKVSLLRPAVGESLRCRATVLRAGRTLSVVEADVFAVAAKDAGAVAIEKHVARLSSTLAIVSAKVGRR